MRAFRGTEFSFAVEKLTDVPILGTEKTQRLGLTPQRHVSA
jgi:hypothetical protein